MMQKLKVDMDIGSNLRKLRKEHGYTQDQLTARISRYGVDITRAYYSRYETGELNIPVQVLVALHQLYGCQGKCLPYAVFRYVHHVAREI